MHDLRGGLPVSVTDTEDIHIVPAFCADSTHRRRSRAAGWRTVVTTIRGEFDCVRFVRPIRCRRALSGRCADIVVFVREQVAPTVGFPEIVSYPETLPVFPGASDLAGVYLPFRVVSAVLNLLGSCPVVAEAVGRFLRIFHPAVIRRAVVLPVRGIVSVPVLSSRICSRIVYPESVSIRMCGRRPRKRLQDRVENGGEATVFSVAMIFGIPTSGVPCFSG